MCGSYRFVMLPSALVRVTSATSFEPRNKEWTVLQNSQSTETLHVKRLVADLSDLLESEVQPASGVGLSVSRIGWKPWNRLLEVHNMR